MKLLLLVLTMFILSGCSMVSVTITGDGNTVFVEQPKTVNTSTDLTASGNKIPVSTMP